MNDFKIGDILYPAEKYVNELKSIKGYNIPFKRKLVAIEKSRVFNRDIYVLETLTRLDSKTHEEFIKKDADKSFINYHLKDLEKNFIIVTKKIIYPDE